MVEEPARGNGNGPTGVLWGREREAEVLGQLAGSLGRAARGVLILGEPGIGKSTLWARGVASVVGTGARALATTCAEAEREMPYVGLEDLLGAVFDRYAGVLPAPQRAALDAAFVRAHADTAANPRTVAAGVLTLLRRVLQDGPVLLAIDDLQWIDGETHTCLAYAVRRITDRRLSVLLSARDQSPLWQHGREPADGSVLADGVEQLRLGPLSVEAIRGLLSERLGIVVAPGVSERIAEETGGNPFWALEFGRGRYGLASAGPPSLSALVTDRIADLDTDVVEVACLVAALGRPRTARVLPAVEAGDAGGVLDRAVAAGLVTVDNDRVRPSHPLVGAALVAALLPFHRRRLYRRAAELAESAEARAVHLVRAESEETEPADDDPATGPHARFTELLAALDDACRAARGRGAASTAARFADRALRVSEAHPDPAADPRSRQDRMVGTAELHHEAGELDATLAMLDKVDLAALDVELLERAVPLLAQTTNEKRGAPAARAVVDRLETLPHNELGAQQGRRQALLGTLRADLQCGAIGDRRALARTAVEQTEASGAGLALRRRALGALAASLLEAGEPAAEVLDRLASLTAPDGTRPGSGVDVEIIHGLSRWYALDITGARAAFATTFERHLLVGDAPAIARAGALLVYADLLAGSVPSAEENLARLEDHVDRRSPERLDVVGARCAVLLAHGEHDAIDKVLDQHDTTGNRSARNLALSTRLRGLAALQHGDPARALELFDRFYDTAEQYGFQYFYQRIDANADLTDALVAVGAYDRAERIAAQLAPEPETAHPITVGQHRRLLAQLAAHRDRDLDRAAALAREAVALHEDCAIPLEHGRSLVTLAAIHDLRGEPAAAAEDRRRANAVFVRTGHRWWATHTAAPDRAAASVRALSTRERAVAAHVAAGASNREVATALHLSVRTVENHLRTIYRKLAIRSRTELAGHPGIPERS